MTDYRAEYDRWLENTAEDAELHEELMSMADDPKRMEDSFYTELAFGTAGLRGVIGAGTNRMNRFVVRRASAGLAKYLLMYKSSQEHGVAIAYDSRHFSREFAFETAATIAGFGIKCYLYSTLHSVPQLSFAVRELNCIAGVVITASHNPPEYNGYKVYWSYGGQAGPRQADAILESIRKIDYFSVKPMDFDTAVAKGLIVMIGSELDEIYYKKTMSLIIRPDFVREHGGELSIVYTPLHGSGLVPVTEVLRRMGITNCHVVPEQEQPDGSFPTVKAPNPEDANAFTLAMELADRVDANLLLATDPDSDRLGVAIRTDDGRFRVLTGNQIACILLRYILSARQQNGTLPDNGLVVKSIVSTSLADAVCRRYGVELRNVLTGFRFIGELIDRAQASGDNEFLFGFEESYGFLAGSFVRDKDAVCASMLAAEAAVYYNAAEGKTLYDVLQDIYAEYGFYVERTKSYTLKGKEGMELIAGAISSLRINPPCEFGGESVLCFEDYESGVRNDRTTGESTELELPKSNLLRFILPDDAWIVVRPSGTEPKLKLYIGAKAGSADEAEARLERLLNAADSIVSSYLK